MENQNDSRRHGSTGSQTQGDERKKKSTIDNDERTSHKEGPVAKSIETQTSKLPSDLFLWTGLGLLATSVVLHAFKQKHVGLAVGQFAAPVLIMGLYNKIVKQAGHDFLQDEPV
jgi:hypothetical protein